MLVGLALTVTAGCSGGGSGDQLQVVENPKAAVAPASPEPSREPAGTVLAGKGVRAVAAEAESRTLAVALAAPAEVLLYDLDRLQAPPRRVALPAAAAQLTAAPGVVLAAIPSAGRVARISLPGGTVNTLTVRGGPADAAVRDGQTLVALRQRKGVAVLNGGRITATITGGLYGADEVVVAGGHALVLDRKRTAVFALDLADHTLGEGLRAGQGATNAVADSFGRVLVADTRGGGLLAFSIDPLLLRQRFPVPGGIYGLAYDPRRHLVWATLTKRNEVVAFDVRGGEPREKYRYPTVRQPNSVTVDKRTSRVIIGSATGEGIQVISP
jgi:hypothetical protein